MHVVLKSTADMVESTDYNALKRKRYGIDVDIIGKDRVDYFQIEPRLGSSHSTEEIVRAKYVVGCDGAHSWTRKHLQIPFCGQQANIAWGKGATLVRAFENV